MSILPLVIAALTRLHAASASPFEVRAVPYSWSGIPAVAILVTTKDTAGIDSLDVRVWVRSKDTVGTHSILRSNGVVEIPMTFPDAVATKYDICQHYDDAGFNKPCDDAKWGGSWSWSDLSQSLQLASALPAGDRDGQGLRDWAFDLPLGPSRLSVGQVIRFDVLFASRTSYSGLLSASRAALFQQFGAYVPDRTPPAVGDTGWWDATAQPLSGFDLANSWSFANTPAVASQSSTDSAFRETSSNSHIQVRRKGVALWGTAPDGSGPGTWTSTAISPDSGGILPYARIAAPVPVAGDRGHLDSLIARPGRIRVNQAGYRLQDVAAGRARVRLFGSATSFQLQSEGGALRSGGTFAALAAQVGTRIVVCEQPKGPSLTVPTPKCRIDSDSLKTSIPVGPVQEATLPVDLASGRWRVVTGSDTSSWFAVSDSVYQWVRDAALRFLGVQRSGDSSWFHGPSHMLDGSVEGVSGAYVGGWYDGGDHLKEPQTMASVLATLSALAAARPDRDADRWGAVHRADQGPDGVPDVLKEARWGASFFVNSWLRHGRTTGPNGTDSGMVTGVGDFGKDHGWWGPADLQDKISAVGRGGPSERPLRRELGANTLGDVAASLAMLSRLWRSRDGVWADSALAAAKDMYAYAKAHRVVASSDDYNGASPSNVNANLALAATGLLWATRDSGYLREIAYDTAIGKRHSSVRNLSSFDGGWMAMSNPNLTKDAANTDWAHRHSLALWAFARLVLLDADTARALGVANEAERAVLLRRAAAGLQTNLANISDASGTRFVDLPSLDPNAAPEQVSVDTRWGTLMTVQDWIAPGRVAGNAAEVAMYADLAQELAAGKGGSDLAAVAWPVDKATRLAVNQLDWILGLNHWDVSQMAGVGAKNFQDAHHRTANPDGITTWITYDYRTPVGALWGFSPSDTSKASVRWDDYHHAEATIDGCSQMVLAAQLLAPQAAKPTGVVAPRRIAGFGLSARLRGDRILAQVRGLPAREPVRLDVLDASGRRLASLETLSGADGAAQALLPAAHGICIVRAKTADLSRTQAIAAP